MNDNDMVKISRSEWMTTQNRLRKLAEEKAHLQMMNNLMGQLSRAKGLDETVDTMLRIVLETIGGVRISLYYFIDDRIYYADVFGHRQKIERISDAEVEEVIRTKTFTLNVADISETQMQPLEFNQSNTYIFPLLAGDVLVGVFKIEGMIVQADAFQSFLGTFFHYAALSLQHEIMGFSALQKTNAALQRTNQQLSQDIILASEVQKALLSPDFSDPFLVLESIFEPYHIVSGDFFDYIWSKDHNRFSGFVLDVSGHGIASSLQGLIVSTFFRETLESPMSLAAKLQWINSRVLRYFTDGTFAAAICFEFDFAQQTLSYACAGIYKFMAASAALPMLVTTPGSLIGVVDNPEYFETTVPIHEGETFYFMSDGLFERISESLKLRPAKFEETVKRLRILARSASTHDDCAALCIRIAGRRKFPMCFEISRQADRTRIRSRIRDVLKNLMGEQAGRVDIAIGEAMNNAARQSMEMYIKISVIRQCLVIRVRDGGKGFDGNGQIARFHQSPKEDLFDERLMDEGGRGILIMVAWMDKVIYNRVGNEMMLIKKMPQIKSILSEGGEKD